MVAEGSVTIGSMFAFPYEFTSMRLKRRRGLVVVEPPLAVLAVVVGVVVHSSSLELLSA
jgi:hypothetical protein